MQAGGLGVRAFEIARPEQVLVLGIDLDVEGEIVGRVGERVVGARRQSHPFGVVLGFHDAGRNLVLSGQPSAHIDPVRSALEMDLVRIADTSVDQRLRTGVRASGGRGRLAPGPAPRQPRRHDRGGADNHQNDGATLDLHRIFTELNH